MGEKLQPGEGHCGPGIGTLKNSHHWCFLVHLLEMTGMTPLEVEDRFGDLLKFLLVVFHFTIAMVVMSHLWDDAQKC